MKARPARVSVPTLLGAALLTMSAAGWWLDRTMFLAAWLAAWWFCLGMVLGSVIHAEIHVLTGGRWGAVLAPAHHLLQRPLPWLVPLFLPVIIGAPALYPWAGAVPDWSASMAQPAFAQTWFTPWFVALRLVVYCGAWWRLARGPASPTPGRAAIALIVCMVVTSLAAVDLLMSLVPGWTSSVFGWLALVGQMTTGIAAATALTASHGKLPTELRTTGSVPVWRDLGNLILMNVMLQAYLQYMQLLIIWAENLPREISWYLPRFQTGWAAVGVVLALLQFVIPFLALLWRRIKDKQKSLGRVAWALLAAQALGTAWLVVPSVRPQDEAAWWLLPLTFLGMALLLFGHLWPARGRAPGSADAHREVTLGHA